MLCYNTRSNTRIMLLHAVGRCLGGSARERAAVQTARENKSPWLLRKCMRRHCRPLGCFLHRRWNSPKAKCRCGNRESVVDEVAFGVAADIFRRRPKRHLVNHTFAGATTTCCLCRIPRAVKKTSKWQTMPPHALSSKPQPLVGARCLNGARVDACRRPNGARS